MSAAFVKLSQLKSAAELEGRFAELGWQIPVDPSPLSADQRSPLAAPWELGGLLVGNRWCAHPMEGWDAESNGAPSELTLRRWRRFGSSGAKLIWGGEAAAVLPHARANPRQTTAGPENLAGLRQLRRALLDSHEERFGLAGLVVGLQLTHSGRFSRPASVEFQPRVAYHHPLLDRRVGIQPGDDRCLLTDAEVETIIEAFATSAAVARDAGFDFVDVKACHGYLLHEFLSARDRAGPYGGDLAGRSRLLLAIIGRIRTRVPDLRIAVRLSVFDTPPFARHGQEGRMESLAHCLPYHWGFGCAPGDPLQMDLREPLELIGCLQQAGVAAVSVTCGSPYYNPHQQRPAMYPPSDGYPLPEDPLHGVARHLVATQACKAAFPQLPIVGAGFSYLQDFLPHVAQAVVRGGWMDAVGLGRMMLSYPELPDDVLRRQPWRRKQVCRTFSDCTTGPRKGLVSGCYPLDDYYRGLPDATMLAALKRQP